MKINLMGVTEIAALAEVTRQAITNWTARDSSFPAPVADLACGQIWLKEDVVKWLKQNQHLTREKPMSENLEIGKIYTHDYLCEIIGGDIKGGSYLPQSKQKILCGCFTQLMNPDAPNCVLVGNKPRVIAKAELMARQGGIIPVFIKRAISQWEYRGCYKFITYSKDSKDFEEKAVLADRNDVVGALFFKKVV